MEVSPAELQDARENLDAAQEELAELTTRVEALQEALERANKKVELYALLVAGMKNAKAAVSSESTVDSGLLDMKEVTTMVKAAVIEVKQLLKFFLFSSE